MTNTRATARPRTHRGDDDRVARTSALVARGTWTPPLVHAPPVAAVPASVEATLRAPGQPLDAATRDAVERHFGCDFTHVRIHRDPTAAASARAIGARAYSVGPHIVFAPGRYAPSTLLHELAHVVQRAPGAPMPAGPLTLGAADSAHERAARAVAQHGPSDSLRRGPTLPAHVVARDADEDEAERRAALAVLARDTLAGARPIQRADPDPAPREKDPKLIIVPHTRGRSDLVAADLMAKRTTYPGSAVVNPTPRKDGPEITIIGPRRSTGHVRSTERSQSVLINDTRGNVVAEKDIASDKTFHGVTLAAKGGNVVVHGAPMKDGETEIAIGSSEKTTAVRTRNAAATTDTTTIKNFSGTKHTTNGFDPRGDFHEHEVVTGREARKVLTAIESRGSKGQVVARERSLRDTTSEGRTIIDLRNTGTKYQALDLGRTEVLSGRRSERLAREVDHADGSRQRELSSTDHRGEMKTRERSRRLSRGRELRAGVQSSVGTARSTKSTELSPGDAAGTGYTRKTSRDASYGSRTNVTLAVNKPGAAPIAARITPGSRVTGGKLGLITATDPDSRTVIVGDKTAYEEPANANLAGGYTESLAFEDSARVAQSDNYEVTERGVSANLSRESETGTLRNFLRKDRFNFGWLMVENALTDYYLDGTAAKVSGGLNLGRDVNNVNLAASYSRGWTRRVGNEVTIRMGGFFVKLKAEADAFAGIEAALSAEIGRTRGAGLGAGASASAFAGARAGLGGKVEGGFQGVSFAAGGYKLRGSLGLGFKANIEARYKDGYFLLAGGLAVSKELGVGADVELRINPTALAASFLKGAAGLADTKNFKLAEPAGELARKAANRARSAASSAVGAYHRLRDLFR